MIIHIESKRKVDLKLKVMKGEAGTFRPDGKAYTFWL